MQHIIKLLDSGWLCRKQYHTHKITPYMVILDCSYYVNNGNIVCPRNKIKKINLYIKINVSSGTVVVTLQLVTNNLFSIKQTQVNYHIKIIHGQWFQRKRSLTISQNNYITLPMIHKIEVASRF